MGKVKHGKYIGKSSKDPVEDLYRRARYVQKLKTDLLTHYGNGKLSCVICGEDRIDCLSIDHIDGKGKDHLKKCGFKLYVWLKKEGFPKGFRTLCMNCQFMDRRKRERENLEKKVQSFLNS